jgi:pyruvate dehydrogenase E2 component (dihydrolipoamide acetyltransferase)
VAEVKEVRVPDIGDFTDVPVIEVLVAAGDEVKADDPLVTLESDKATMEIPAPEGGVVGELKVKVGDTVSEGDVVVTMTPSAEPSAEADTGAAAKAAEPEVATAVAAEQAAAPEETAKEPPAPAAPAPAASSGNGAPYASPSVRKRARELGVDLATIAGSGRKGRITLEDLDKPAAPAAAPARAAAPSGEEYREPLTRIQVLSKNALTKSWTEIPHVTQHEDADITDLEAFRKQLNAEQSHVKVTMVALLLKAVSATLDKFPRFASSLDGDELIMKPQRHLGFAADTPQGLVVPVIRDVGQKGILELAADLTELSGKARSGKLGPRDISGAVFTISSLGGIGGTGFTPIVNGPQVAILGVSRSVTKPVWNGTEFVPRLIVPLSLSYDHRVIDGAAAARFCVHLAGLLKDMRRALL